MDSSHRQFGKDGKGRTTQLDFIIGHKRALHETYMHNDVELWDTWDHYPIYVLTHEDDHKTIFT